MRENKNGATAKQPMVPKWLQYTIVALLPAIGIFVIALCIWLFVSSISDAFLTVGIGAFLLLFVGIGTFLILLGWNFYSAIDAKYKYTANGLLVKYPFEAEQLLPWDCFQQVCICYGAYSTRGEQMACSVICFVKHGEKKNGSMRWKTGNPFRHRSVICIDYTPELFEQVKAVCPYDIPDLRNAPAYKMYW